MPSETHHLQVSGHAAKVVKARASARNVCRQVKQVNNLVRVQYALPYQTDRLIYPDQYLAWINCRSRDKPGQSQITLRDLAKHRAQREVTEECPAVVPET